MNLCLAILNIRIYNVYIIHQHTVSSVFTVLLLKTNWKLRFKPFVLSSIWRWRKTQEIPFDPTSSAVGCCWRCTNAKYVIDFSDKLSPASAALMDCSAGVRGTDTPNIDSSGCGLPLFTCILGTISSFAVSSIISKVWSLVGFWYLLYTFYWN